MNKENNKRNCFVISPIGELDSDTRKRADKLLKHVITDALHPLGYKVERADSIPEPGLITDQVINRVIEADLVVADLSGGNPNVFYELAIRHAIKKPFVQIARNKSEVPFDVSTIRTIFVDVLKIDDLDDIGRAKDDLRKQVKTIQENSDDIKTPIASALTIKSLTESHEAGLRQLAEVSMEIRTDVKNILHRIKSEQPTPSGTPSSQPPPSPASPVELSIFPSPLSTSMGDALQKLAATQKPLLDNNTLQKLAATQQLWLESGRFQKLAEAAAAVAAAYRPSLASDILQKLNEEQSSMEKETDKTQDKEENKPSNA